MTSSNNHTLFRILPSSLSESEFIERFAGVYEHSPWVAQQYWQQQGGKPSNFIENMYAKIIDIVNNQDYTVRKELILKHPDLAGRAAAAGELTTESSEEQASAGLDRCSSAELARFTRLNDAYKARFGFPFIMAVRNSDRYAILDAFEERLDNTPEMEFERAMQEIHKIALFRLQEL